MERTEASGFGVALLLHAALIALLSLAVRNTLETPPPAMEVSFVEDAAVVSSVPASIEPPAPAVGEELGPVEEASGAAAAAVPEPAPAPAPEPEAVPAPPTTTADRRRPDITRNAVPIRPPVPRPVQSAEARPQPPRPDLQQQQRAAQQRAAQQQAAQQRVAQQRAAQQQAAQRAAQQRAAQQSAANARAQAQRSGQGQAQRSSGSVLDRLSREFGRGPAAARGTAPQPAAALSAPQRQALARNISGLIQPCAARATPPNGLARTISVDLRVTVNQNGAPVSHQMVGSSGTNDANEGYVDGVVDVAMRAVRACSSRIASLPDDQYGVPGGWRTFRYRFRFP